MNREILRAHLTILMWEELLIAGGYIALGNGAMAMGDTRVAIAFPLTVEGPKLPPEIGERFLRVVESLETEVLSEYEK